MSADYATHLLVIAPHPDDAEIFCGGIILNAVVAGHRVGVLDLTRGELSSRGDLKSRAAETDEASKVLGLSFRENLELPDGSIGLSLSDHRKRLVSAIRKHRPEIVLFPAAEERHPDHVRAHPLTREALFFAGTQKFLVDEAHAPHHPRATYCYQMRHVFTPSLVVDVSDVYAKKEEAIRCYRTQLGLDDAKPTTLLSSPLTLSSIKSRDGYYGAMIGRAFGEPLLSPAMFGTSDIVVHSRTALHNPALFFPQRT